MFLFSLMSTIRYSYTLVVVLYTAYGSVLIDFVHFIFFLFVYSEIMLNFAAEIKWITIMDIKKITHEEALRRWKHSLEIKREWERKVAERWANEDQQKMALV